MDTNTPDMPDSPDTSERTDAANTPAVRRTIRGGAPSPQRSAAPSAQSAGLARMPGVTQSAIISSIIAVLMALLARFLLNISTPAEIFGDRLTRFIPLPVFSQMLNLFGTSTKHLYFGG